MFPPPIELAIVAPNLHTLVWYNFFIELERPCPPRALTIQGNSYVKINLVILQPLGNLIKCLQGCKVAGGGGGGGASAPFTRNC